MISREIHPAKSFEPVGLEEKQNAARHVIAGQRGRGQG